jgi:hypothetical protein
LKIGNYLAAYFTVRARALAGFIIAIVAMILDLLVGRLLDTKSFSRRSRARVSWIIIAGLFFVAWIWCFVIQAHFAKSDPDLDWSSALFGRGVGSFIFYRIAYEAGKCSLIRRSLEMFGLTLS